MLIVLAHGRNGMILSQSGFPTDVIKWLVESFQNAAEDENTLKGWQ